MLPLHLTSWHFAGPIAELAFLKFSVYVSFTSLVNLFLGILFFLIQLEMGLFSKFLFLVAQCCIEIHLVLWNDHISWIFTNGIWRRFNIWKALCVVHHITISVENLNVITSGYKEQGLCSFNNYIIIFRNMIWI